MKRAVAAILFFVVLFFSCGGPEPYSEKELATVYKVDSIYTMDGSWMTGPDLFYIQQENKPVKTWPFWVVIVGVVLVSSIGFSLVRRKYRARLLRCNAAESQAVIALLKDRVMLVKNLAETHEKTERRNRAFSYPDELEALQETVDSYRAYLEELRADTHLMGYLEMALNAGKDNIMSKARQLLGKSLSEQDYIVMACYLAGMTTSSISFVTGIKPGTVRTKKSRMKEKINNMPDCSDKHDILAVLDAPL